MLFTRSLTNICVGHYCFDQSLHFASLLNCLYSSETYDSSLLVNVHLFSNLSLVRDTIEEMVS